MKSFLLPLLLSSLAFSEDDAVINTNTKVGIEMDFMGISDHSNHYGNWNQTNLGLGVDLTFEVNPKDHALIAVSMGQYRDSFNSQADYILVGPRWLLFGDYSTFHSTFGASIGMLNGSGNKGLAIVPCISLGWKFIDICVIGSYAKDNNVYNTDGSIDRGNSATSMVGVFLRLHLLTFQDRH